MVLNSFCYRDSGTAGSPRNTASVGNIAFQKRRLNSDGQGYILLHVLKHTPTAHSHMHFIRPSHSRSNICLRKRSSLLCPSLNQHSQKNYNIRCLTVRLGCFFSSFGSLYLPCQVCVTSRRSLRLDPNLSSPCLGPSLYLSRSRLRHLREIMSFSPTSSGCLSSFPL